MITQQQSDLAAHLVRACNSFRRDDRTIHRLPGDVALFLAATAIQWVESGKNPATDDGEVTK